ncbi:MAG: hypothetical protein ACERKN_19385 [Velocimicrobium sp.]
MKKEEYDNLEKQCEILIRNQGNKKKALIFMLSLQPYQFRFLDKIFVDSMKLCNDVLIASKYAEYEYERLFSYSVPIEFYNDHKKLLENYYNNFDSVNLGTEKIVVSKNDHQLERILSNDYIISNRNMIELLCEEINLEKLIITELSPMKLRTFWYNTVKSQRLEEGCVALPNSLRLETMCKKDYWYLYWLLINEQESFKWNTWESLCERIQYDYDVPIDNQAMMCANCKYKDPSKECVDCQQFIEMSDEEQKIEIHKPDYKALSIEKMIKDLAFMIKKGLLYIAI